MKILGISASPRIGGNTDLLLDRVLLFSSSKGTEVEKINLALLKYSPCLECDNVKQDGTCKVEDDMRKVYKAVEEADILVLASPVFFGSLSAQAKMMIDRFQCRWLAVNVFGTIKEPRRRPGIFLAVEASQRQDFFENAKAVVKNWFKTAGISYKGELFCSGVESKGAINEHPGCLQRAEELGKKIAGGGIL